MAEENPNGIPEPGFLERLYGTLTIASLAYIGIVLVINIPDLEALAIPEEIPGVGAALFFGELWLNRRSKRMGLAKEQHPLHPIISEGKARRQARRAG